LEKDLKEVKKKLNESELENEELKQLLSQTDNSDYEIIHDDSDYE
jgi:hypothetical protein